MADLAFAKIPLLLTSIWFVRVCGKSPQPAPKKCEESKFTGLEVRGFRAIIRWVPPLLVLPSMILTLVVEAFQIMLNQNQAHYFPRSVVGRLSSPIGSSSGRGIGLTVSFMVGWLMLAAGACIRATCYHHLGRFFTFELALRENHQLVTTGPYAVVRHPAYTGSVLALVGMAVMQLGPGSWWADVAGMWSTPAGVVLGCAWLGLLSIIPVGIVARTAAEDKVLHKEFGQQWEAWAQNTPYRLVPGIF